MTTTARIPGLRGEFLWELDIATRQVVGVGNAIPAEKYSWRPDPQARSVSEVFVHIGAGIFAEFMADSQVPWGVEALSGAISRPA